MGFPHVTTGERGLALMTPSRLAATTGLLPIGKRKSSVSALHKSLVHKTPPPIFARFKGLDNRMIGRVEMLSGVPIGRFVTAPDMAADQAKPQMHPPITGFQTIFTTLGAGCDLLDETHMLARHWIPLAPQSFDWLALVRHDNIHSRGMQELISFPRRCRIRRDWKGTLLC